MFCRQCGKELTDGAKFCKHCGAALDAGNRPAAEKAVRKQKKSKGGIIAALVAVLLVAAVGVGVVLYLNSDSYHIKKNMKLAEECFAEGEYKDALSYYKAALKSDPSLVDAYLGSADIYMEESRYQDAVDILGKGMDKIRGRKKESLQEKLEDIYSLWVTALISEEDYAGAKIVLDSAAALDAAALAEERQRVEQAESGFTVGTDGSAGTEELPEAGAAADSAEFPEDGAAADSVESSAAESLPVSEVAQESNESIPEQPQFILPESDSRYLAMEELAGLTAEECRIARNELFARHGRLFKDEELQAYFNSCDWYYGWVMPADFDESVFNEYEAANRDLIIKYEKEQGYR